MDLVVDASASVAWFLPDEFDAQAAALLDFVAVHGALVPALWAVEMQNALRNAHRRRRVNADGAQDILLRLAQLPLRVVDATERPAFHGALALALEHDLSVYDAVYLDVAMRYRAHLASRDARVVAIAQSVGIATTLPGREAKS